MHCYRNCTIFVILIFFVSLVSCQISRADSPKQFSDVLNSYANSVFRDGKAERLLPPIKMFDKLVIRCDSYDCDRISPIMANLAADGQKILYSGKDTSADVVLFKRIEDIPDVPFDRIVPGTIIDRSGDADCMLAQKRTEKSIERFFIFANTNQTDRFLHSCVIFQYLRGMGIELWPGLQFKYVFSESNGGLASLSDSDFERLAKGARVFLQLHSCETLKSITNRGQVVAKFEAISCLNQLKN